MFPPPAARSQYSVLIRVTPPGYSHRANSTRGNKPWALQDKQGTRAQGREGEGVGGGEELGNFRRPGPPLGTVCWVTSSRWSPLCQNPLSGLFTMAKAIRAATPQQGHRPRVTLGVEAGEGRVWAKGPSLASLRPPHTLSQNVLQWHVQHTSGAFKKSCKFYCLRQCTSKRG